MSTRDGINGSAEIRARKEALKYRPPLKNDPSLLPGEIREEHGINVSNVLIKSTLFRVFRVFRGPSSKKPLFRVFRVFRVFRGPSPKKMSGEGAPFAARGSREWNEKRTYEQPLVVPQSSQTVQVPLRLTREEPQLEHISPV